MAIEIEQHIDEAAFVKANAQGAKLLASHPLVTVARYQMGRIHLELNNGCAFELPVKSTQGLLGNKQWMVSIGAAGGRATTKAKTAAARANGQLGGRPKAGQPKASPYKDRARSL
jgi:hypothetical protein